MPTENRSSNTEMAKILSPFAAVADCYSDAEDDSFEPARDHGQHKDLALTLGQFRAVRALLDHPLACSHEWTDDGAWLLVCNKCGAQENHEPYGWVQTRGNAINRFTQEWDIVQEWEDQGFQYKAMHDHPASADAGEVERLREAHTNLANLYGKQRLDLEQLQAQLAEEQRQAAFYKFGFETKSAQLAERDALLREQSGKLIVLAARLLQEPLRALNGDLDSDRPITRAKVADGVERAGDSLGGLALEVRRAADALSACIGPTCPICHGTLRVKEPGQDEGDCTRCIEALSKS